MKTSLRFFTVCALLCGALGVVAGCSEQPLGPEEGSATAGTDDRAPGITDADGRTYRLAARLTPSDAEPHASGTARFEVHGDRRHFATEVTGVSTDGTGQVMVSRGDRVLLHARIRIEHGAGRLLLSPAHGHHVPQMEPGDHVGVLRADGTPALRGALRHVR